MKTIALIPARGGSKGLPGKNIKSLAGKPLIVWSIEQAINSDLIDEVYLSTDCPEIKLIAERAGAKVPFLRPDNISTDSASTESAMIHFCEWLIKNEIDCDNLLLIQATSPVREHDRFDNAIYEFEKSKKDSLLTVVPSHRFIWKDLEEPKASYDYKNRPRRQDLIGNINYMETGSFYISKFSQFMREGNRLFGEIYMYQTPENESYEIDTLIDFKVCEILMDTLG